MFLKSILVILSGGLTSNAATKVSYADKSGVTVTFEQALKLSSNGELVYRCQPVKAALSKSGTSVSFKVVK